MKSAIILTPPSTGLCSILLSVRTQYSRRTSKVVNLAHNHLQFPKKKLELSDNLCIAPLQRFLWRKRPNSTFIKQENQKALRRNKILTSIKAHNSVTNEQNITGNNSNLDIVNIIAFTKFGEILSI